MVDDGAGRRDRRQRGRSRHSDASARESFVTSFESLGGLAVDGIVVSAAVFDLDTGSELLAVDESVSLPVAQLGTLLLLIEVAAQIESGALPPLETVPREGDGGDLSPAGPGGLWPYLQRRELAVVDAATLVGAVRDASAVNALVARVGLDAVRARGESLGLSKTALLDLARPQRGPDDAPNLAVGSAYEFAGLMTLLTTGGVVSRAVSDRVIGWLSLGSDLTLVAAPFGLDPHAHRRADHDLQLVNVTGADAGVRAEAGVLRGPRHAVAYAVIVSYDDLTLAHRLRVLEGLHAVGADLLEYVH
ncbi:serine hydrolase [Frigoribacterium sp. 2-23]|uniref:serine hydrolase n=1 Tax=Frigoribacterium sp. 2-23 TaxID=3415006 RepID=UPI003C6F7600